MQMPLPLVSRLDEAVARTQPRVNLGFAQCRASVRTPSVTAPSSNDRLQALAEQSAQGDQSNGLARRNRLGSLSMAAGVGSEVCANSDARPLQACGVGLPSVSVTATARCRSQSGRHSRPAFRLRDPHAAQVLLKTDQQVCGCEGSVGSWRGASCGRRWPRAGVASHAGPRADSAGCAHSVSWFRSAVRTRSRNPRAGTLSGRTGTASCSAYPSVRPSVNSTGSP